MNKKPIICKKGETAVQGLRSTNTHTVQKQVFPPTENTCSQGLCFSPSPLPAPPQPGQETPPLLTTFLSSSVRRMQPTPLCIPQKLLLSCPLLVAFRTSFKTLKSPLGKQGFHLLCSLILFIHSSRIPDLSFYNKLSHYRTALASLITRPNQRFIFLLNFQPTLKGL